MALYSVENLCCWPSGIPNSCLCRLRVLGDIPSILAISTQRNPNASLSSWICSCLISYLGLSAFTYPAGLFRGWRVTDDGWRVAGGGWRVTGGGWRVTGSGWRVVGQAIKNEKRDTLHPNPNVSPATPHPPPTTRNPPPVTRHPLPAEKSCRLRTRPCEQGFQHYLTFRE